MPSIEFNENLINVLAMNAQNNLQTDKALPNQVLLNTKPDMRMHVDQRKIRTNQAPNA